MYSSALSILPRFLWKLTIEYLSVESIFRFRTIKSCKLIFTNAYCKELILSDRIGRIALIKTNSSVIKNFWKYALDNHVDFDDLDDALRSIEKKKIMRYVHITIFIKTGVYIMRNMQNTIRLHDKNCSISINGSKIGATHIVDNMQQNDGFYLKIRVAQYISIKYVTFNIDIRFDGIKKMYHSQSLNLYKCIFNNGIGQRSIQHFNMAKCIICGDNGNTNCIIKDSILNTHTCITIMGFNTNTIHITLENSILSKSEYILWFIVSINANILIKNNIISNVDSLIGFHTHFYKYVCNNIIIMQNNTLTQIFNKYKHIEYEANNIYSELNLSTSCGLAINNTNTLTNCGFNIDQS